MKRKLLLYRLCGACTLTAAAVFCSSAHAGALSIANAGFETDAAPVVGASGWTITSTGDAWVTTNAMAPDSVNDPDAAAEGEQWLSGNRLATGSDTPASPQVIAQLIDISGDAALIDAGSALVNLSFQFSDSDSADDAEVNIDFFSDVAGTTAIGTSLGTGVLAETAPNGTANAPWELRSLAGAVPASARSLQIEILNTRIGGTAGNVHFDDFSGAIVPEPAGVMLIALGACLVGVRSTRR